jgi:hypothetical protein
MHATACALLASGLAVCSRLVRGIHDRKEKRMATDFVLVKTAYPVDRPIDALDLDSDPTFKADDYRKVAEQMCSNVVWDGDQGAGTMFGHVVALIPTDAGLFMNFSSILTTAQAEQLSKQALGFGAVVLDTESADMLTGGFEL